MVPPRMLFGPPVLPPDPPRATAAVQSEQPTEPLQLVQGQIVHETLTLRWDGPTICPRVADFETLVSGYLAERKRPAQTLEVEGQVRRGPVGWHLSLSLAKPGKTTFRELDAGDCELLTRGAALLVAVHVDAVGATTRVAQLEGAREDAVTLETELTPVVLEPPETPDTGPPQTGVLRILTPPVVRQRRLPILKRASNFGLLRLTGTGAVGALPGFLQDFGLTGGVQLGAWRIEGELDYSPSRSVAHPDNTLVSGNFQALDSTLRGCWVPYFERIDIPLCAGVRVGGIRGVGAQGVDEPQPNWAPWGALALEPGVTWSASPNFALFGSLGLLVALRRPAFEVGSSEGRIYGRPAVSALISFGFEVRIFSRKNPPN